MTPNRPDPASLNTYMFNAVYRDKTDHFDFVTPNSRNQPRRQKHTPPKIIKISQSTSRSFES
jgi:hypothetical protein